MSVRIGINPITWANDDDPRLGGDTSLDTILRETKQAGFAGTELGGKFPRQSSVLGPLLKQHGLALVSGWYDGRILEKDVSAEYEAILPHLTLLRDLGAKVVVYADTSRGRHDGIFRPVSQRPKLDDAEWPAYGRKTTALANRFADFGVRMAFHHHMGTFVETDHEVDQLMRHSGESVGLLFDTGHCIYARGNPATLLERHIHRVSHVHCKDVRRPVLEQAWKQDLSFMGAVMEGIFTVPGDGSVDYPPLLKRLHDAGYAGWLVVEAEQDPAKAHPLTYATLGYKNLRRMAEAAAFEVAP
jgi:inosose dehydratase